MSGDGEEEDGLPSSAARLEERRSDQEVRTKRWKERRLLLQVLSHTQRSDSWSVCYHFKPGINQSGCGHRAQFWPPSSDLSTRLIIKNDKWLGNCRKKLQCSAALHYHFAFSDYNVSFGAMPKLFKFLTIFVFYKQWRNVRAGVHIVGRCLTSRYESDIQGHNQDFTSWGHDPPSLRFIPVFSGVWKFKWP